MRGPKARQHTSLGQRPRCKASNATRAESPTDNYSPLRQQTPQIQRPRIHRERPICLFWPLLHRPVPIKLHAIAIRIPQIERLAHSMVCSCLKRYSRIHQPLQRIPQRRPRRIQNRQVIKPRRSGRRRLSARTLSRIQSNVMVIITRRNKRSRIPKSQLQPKPQHAAIKRQRPVDVRDLQMHMPDPRPRINRHRLQAVFRCLCAASCFSRTHANWMNQPRWSFRPPPYEPPATAPAIPSAGPTVAHSHHPTSLQPGCYAPQERSHRSPPQPPLEPAPE